MRYTIEDITLVETCGACPEQYDAFIKDTQVGYLRLRHGSFRVDYPDCGGETIYTADPKGDGCFESDEREYYLTMAKNAILMKINHPNDERIDIAISKATTFYLNGGMELIAYMTENDLSAKDLINLHRNQ